MILPSAERFRKKTRPDNIRTEENVQSHTVPVWLFYVGGAAGGRAEADMAVSSGVTGGNALTHVSR